MSAEEKKAEDKKEGDLSSPNLEELDSAWDSDDDDLDEDATTVQKIPKELVALSRRGVEDAALAAKKTEEPEKHEAITARPPPNAEPSVVVDAPHEKLAKAQERASIADAEENEEEEAAAEDEADEVVAEAEEKRAAAADEAAGLDAEARKALAEARTTARKDKARAKTLAAKEKRKAHVDAQRQKAKKPKRRSTPPRDPEGEAQEKRASDSQPPTSRARATGRPAAMTADGSAMLAGQNRDILRMVFYVAIVVVLGAFVIGLARR